jgi:hypothetical protein
MTHLKIGSNVQLPGGEVGRILDLGKYVAMVIDKNGNGHVLRHGELKEAADGD